LRTSPPKPGLVHVGEEGAPIETEIWRLPAEGLGRLLSTLPRPMTLGRVELADGSRVPGFLCEPGALADAPDITPYGGWRSYLNAARGSAAQGRGELREQPQRPRTRETTRHPTDE